MRHRKEKSIKPSPLLLGAFCSAFLAFVACGGNNSSNTDSTDMGCASEQTRPSENYTSSALMSQILESLKGNTKIDPLGLFKEDSQAVQEKIEKYGVAVSSQTKSSMNFKLEGNDYSFKVLGTKDSVKVSLSSAGTTCELHFQNTFADQCLPEPADITIDSNQAEFMDCIPKIAPTPKEDSGNNKPSYDGEFN